MFISCKPTEKINGFGERDGICRKYDAKNIITFVYNKYSPIIKIEGIWRGVTTHYSFYTISNSQIEIKNDNKETLLVTNYKMNSCKLCSEDPTLKNHKHNFLINNIKRNISFWKEFEKYTIELLETDEENYAVYYLSNEYEKKCVFFGYKNEIFYEFILMNSEKDKKQQAKLLLDSYKLN
jgi:hypothetical protein